ncbi:hypothetical protein Tco_1132708 [Tanacetum coccineum]|uniref:Uncharacterized protein n=1 Tax=Tanacetum coccineum TaxID=301880 RepID=A0ABQ5JCQ0_9ASTR
MVVVWQRLCHRDGGGDAPAVKVMMVSEWWMWWCHGDEGDGDEGGVACHRLMLLGGGGAKVEDDGVDVMLEMVGVATAYLPEKYSGGRKNNGGAGNFEGVSLHYTAFLITAEVPEIYKHQFWHTITKIKNSSSYKFKLDKKKCTIDVEVFRDILQICPRLRNQEFDEPPSDEEIV